MEKENQISNDEDRISALPDALKHEILSHLDMRDVVHTSILSNSWRYIWLSTPYLDFDLDYWLTKCRPNSRITQEDCFMNFVERVLVCRGNSDKILKFRLYSYHQDFDFDLPRVSSWLRKCLERSVQHLVLRFPLGIVLGKETIGLSSLLPESFFSSNVRVLEISFCPDPLVPLPSITPASMIKNLDLHGVRLPDGDANGELDLSFAVAQTLDIDICDVSHLKVITLSAPLLEQLWLRLCVERKREKRMWWTRTIVYLEEKKACNVKVKICTSQLKTLGLVTFSSKYSFPVDYSIEHELLSLDSANIHICTEKYVDKECSQSLIKILQSVHNVRDLDLSISTKQVLTDFPILLEGLPHQFQNLRYIKLGDRMKFPCLHAMTNFLLSFPRIETLVWERNWDQWSRVTNKPEESVANEIEALKSNLLFQNMFGYLETVEFHNLEGIESESEFVAYVLERAILLKKMIIKVNRAISRKKLESFKETCLHLPSASPNVSVSFSVDC